MIKVPEDLLPEEWDVGREVNWVTTTVVVVEGNQCYQRSVLLHKGCDKFIKLLETLFKEGLLHKADVERVFNAE